MEHRMKFVVERRNLKNLALLLTYKILLDYAYLGIIADLFAYMGMEKDVNILKIAAAYILVFVLWLITPTRNYKILNIFVNMQLVIMLIPMLTMYGANNESTLYLSIVLICYAVQCLFCMMQKKYVSVKVNTTNMDFDRLLPLLAVITVGLCILKFGIPSLKALNITRVYEIRIENALSFPLSYLVPWCAKVLIPFGFILSLEEKKYRKSMCYLLLQGILYLSFAHKTFLFIIIVAGGVWLVCRKRWFYQALYSIFPIGIFVSIFIYQVTGNILAISYFVRRVLIVPASLKFIYYEYYSSHPKAHFLGSIIGKALELDSPYEKSIAAQIGEYMGSPQAMMNTGYLGEGYAQGGYFALVIMSLLLLVICKVCTLKKNVNMNVFLPMFILWFYTLNDIAFQTSLMTGGGLILILLFIVWPERKNLYHSGEMPDADAGGANDVRNFGKSRYATWYFRR